jgi:hypothetical protein
VFFVFDLPSHNQACRAGKPTLIDIALVLSDSIVISNITQNYVAHIIYILFTYMLATIISSHHLWPGNFNDVTATSLEMMVGL